MLIAQSLEETEFLWAKPSTNSTLLYCQDAQTHRESIDTIDAPILQSC